MADTFSSGDISAAMSGASGASGTTGSTGATPGASAPASPAGTPAPSGDASASATATPGAAAEPKGPIPFDRHEAILANARKEAETKYGWIGARTREQVEQMEHWYEAVDRDPVAFHRWLGEQLNGRPEYASALTPPTPDPTRSPDRGTVAPDLRTEDGELGYSQSRVDALIRAVRDEIESKVTARLDPLEQTLSAQKMEAATRQRVASEIADARANWEGFTDLEPDIRDRMKADKRLSLHGAYARSFRETYLPKLREKIRTETFTELNQKAHASTASPGQAMVGTKADVDKDWTQLLKEKAGA